MSISSKPISYGRPGLATYVHLFPRGYGTFGVASDPLISEERLKTRVNSSIEPAIVRARILEYLFLINFIYLKQYVLDVSLTY
jgi:hypothetical protein